MAQPRPKVEYAGEDYELYELDSMLGLPAIAPDENAQVPLLMMHAGDLRAALRVDSLLGGREIVVKPVGPQLARIPGVFGATILGDGAVVVILDGAVLLRRAAALRARGEAPSQVVATPTGLRTRPMVMVVDDSITMRKVSGRVLEREGYEVHTAKDGLDALEQMHERVPDLMLLDLEMPRMDGYELAGYMRGDPLSARFDHRHHLACRRKHRARAFELGVNRYLGKPYQESEMINAVAELLAETASRSGWRRLAHERIRTDIRSVLVPISQTRLLLPNAVISEVLTFVSPDRGDQGTVAAGPGALAGLPSAAGFHRLVCRLCHPRACSTSRSPSSRAWVAMARSPTWAFWRRVFRA